MTDSLTRKRGSRKHGTTTRRVWRSTGQKKLETHARSLYLSLFAEQLDGLAVYNVCAVTGASHTEGTIMALVGKNSAQESRMEQAGCDVLRLHAHVDGIDLDRAKSSYYWSGAFPVSPALHPSLFPLLGCFHGWLAFWDYQPPLHVIIRF